MNPLLSIIRKYDKTTCSENIVTLVINFANASFYTVEKNKIFVYFQKRLQVIYFDTEEEAQEESERIERALRWHIEKTTWTY